MALFKNSYKKGEMFQDKGVWFVAENSSYQNAADLEDGFDIFLPGNGVYTVAREATAEEISAHLEVVAQTKAQEAREYQEKYAPIHARLAEEAAKKADAKKEQQRARMSKEYGIGARVQSRYVSSIGKVVAHHETEPKVSVQWNGEDHPACMNGTTLITWFGLNDLKGLTGANK